MKASMFYRIAAVLLLLFAVGHTLGFRQSDPNWGVDALLGSMRSIHFDVQGFQPHVLGPLCGGRTLCRRVLSIRGDIGMAAGWPSGSDFGAHARHCVGVRPLLCRHHGCELEIPLYHTHRFLNRDYIMFDCGGMAFSEAGLKLHHYPRVESLRRALSTSKIAGNSEIAMINKTNLSKYCRTKATFPSV